MIRITNKCFKQYRNISTIGNGFNNFTGTPERIKHSLFNTYKSRKLKKRFFHKIWITQFQIVLSFFNLNYSMFKNILKKLNISINLKLFLLLTLFNIKNIINLIKEIKFQILFFILRFIQFYMYILF